MPLIEALKLYQLNKDFVMKKFVPALVVALALFGCSKNNADQFTGTWKKVGGGGTNMIITHNGSGFLVKEHSAFMGNDNTYSAVANGDGLDISGPMGAIHFVIDKSTGHLIGAGDDMVRAN